MIRRSLVALSLLSLYAIAQTQVPNVFEDGTPAKAAEVNENFQYVLENASGGCSVEQVDNTAEITCADGTTAVLPGYGTVVVLPEGEEGALPDMTINTGKVVVVDANGVVLAEPFSSQNSDLGYYQVYVDPGRRIANLHNDEATETVRLGCALSGCGNPKYFLEENCVGVPFTWLPSYVYEFPEGHLYVVPEEDAVGGTLIFKSTFRGQDIGACENGEFLQQATSLVPYTPAPEILNAAFPARLEQLP